MKSDNEGVALQAVEFWSTICEEETDLAMEMADVRRVFSFSCPFLVVLSFEILSFDRLRLQVRSLRDRAATLPKSLFLTPSQF